MVVRLPVRKIGALVMPEERKTVQQQSNPVHVDSPRARSSDLLVEQVDQLLLLLRQLHQVPARRCGT